MEDLHLITVLLAATIVAGYDNCWDGTNAVEYTGTISTTRTGRTCQNWADDVPHSHGWHGSSPLFPYDGDDVAAQNYCRDPNGGSGTSGTWCFTMDPSWEWDYCDIPLCTNLPCTNGDIVGQSTPASFSASTDTVGGTNYLLDDGASDRYHLPCCGTVSEWRLNLATSGTIRLQVWRLDSGTGSHILIGENVATPSAGVDPGFSAGGRLAGIVSTTKKIKVDVKLGAATVTVSQSDRISFEENDRIGWYADSGLVTYSAGTEDTNRLLTTAAPSVGDGVSFATATTHDNRDYAIGLVVAKSMAPSFTNTVTTIAILETASIGDHVFTLTYTDDDPDDVATLSLTMATNTYFELSGNDVVVKTNLTVTVETLDITVTDHCGETGIYTLTVNVTEVPVTITNLLDSVNVSESTTAQTLLHTLVVSPTGSDTYTCNIDSYLPTRPEGNPFLIANTPTADNGVYLANAANVRYNTAAQLNVTITCTNSGATDSDTSYLVVNIDPNAHPQFDSFVNSATFSVRSTAINDVVYTATVTDAENDPITMSLTCDPTSCPFDVDNAGNVFATSSLSLHQQTTYTVILTADDGFNSVDSSNVSFILTDINVLPVFTNLPGSASDVEENQSVGTSVFQVSGMDANGDAFTYSATYSHADCAAMYDIDSAGLVTTKIVFDYEALTTTSCELVITAFDGYGTSNAANLTVNVADVDEPPDMSGSAFTISTPEVLDNTALPDQSISATDPEATAVTLSIGCGGDDGHLDIHATTGIVTMTTAFDLELAGVDTYTILCTITATDATSQTSTASLSVVVTDANDESPVFVLGGYSANIVVGYSGYGTVLTVAATDADRTSPNNVVTYSLSPTTEFNVDGSGNIYNTADLSAVAVGTVYTLTVTATDGGTPPLSDTAPVTIVITSTTTAAATTTASSSSGGSGSGGSVEATTDFWSSTGNIVLLALVCFLVLLVSAVLGVLLWKHCNRFRPDKPKPHPSTKASEAAPENPKHKLQNEMKEFNKPHNKEKADLNDNKTTSTPGSKLSNTTASPRSNPWLDNESFERAQNYHRPRGPLKEIARERYKPMPTPGGMGQGVGGWPERVVTPRNINIFSINDI